jgi:hypothetical protein
VEGIVIRKKSGFRVVLTLSLLMQSIAIEVDGDDVELAGVSSSLMADGVYQENYKQKNKVATPEKVLQV